MAKLYTNFLFGPERTPQWMLVENGLVVAREPSPSPSGMEWMKSGGERVEAIDLEGRCLYPSFVDAHCHVISTGIDLMSLSLTGAETRGEVLDRIRTRHDELPDQDWLLAVDYDQNRFADGRHITRQELDAISAVRRIHLRHKNWHGSVLNSAALNAVAITKDTPDPAGGVIARDVNGELTGLLLEAAHYMASYKLPTPEGEALTQAVLSAGRAMADLGISATADMKTGFLGLRKEIAAYRDAVERGCPIRLRLCLGYSNVFGPRAEEYRDLLSGVDEDRLKVWGIKIFADGALSSGTAGIYGSFVGQPPAETSGIMNYKQERLVQMVRTAHDAGFPVAVHAIGDYAVDCVMDAFEATGDPARHRIEHAMILSDAQIERLARLGCHVSMQPEFLLRFHYAKVLGPERTAKLKRYRSLLDAGVPLSFGSDRPIVAGDPLDGIRAAVQRPDGFDQSENISEEEARLAYTVGASAATGDEAKWGALLPGQYADFRLSAP